MPFPASKLDAKHAAKSQAAPFAFSKKASGKRSSKRAAPKQKALMQSGRSMSGGGR